MNSPQSVLQVSVVIPVYRGEHSLTKLIEEIAQLNQVNTTPNGKAFAITEVVLVHDCGPDRSDQVIETLNSQYGFVRPIWLSRNFGQHPATLAGMASCTGDWVVTMDEDGQQNPRDIAKMLDMAVMDNLQIVYANPENKPPHGFLRNLASKFAKKIAVALLGDKYDIDSFNSYRLIDGEIARILAAYCGEGVYLDIGLFWTATRIGYCPLTLRHEARNSSYTYSMLLTHFWRMVLNSGTRPLRLITYLGFLSLLLALFFILYALFSKYIERTPVSGWTSVLVITSFFSGLIMVSMGVIAEYLALMMGISMGKPLYIIASKPTRPKGK